MNKFAFWGTLLLTAPVMAGFTEGVSYFDNQQYPQAFAEFKPLADQGLEKAQYYTAYMYLNGYGVPQDTKTGLDYLQKSVDQEYEKAMALLGYYYAEGLFMPQDKAKALELYEKAAEADDDDALLNLGVMYYTGDSVEKDTEKAIELFSRVDLTAKPIVGRYLGDIYQYSEDPDMRKKSRDLYTLAAANGDLSSYHALGYMDQQGRDTPKNMLNAISYYTYAASQSYAPAQYALGAIYANGDGVPRDILKAYAWLSLAANQGLQVAAQSQKQLEKNLTLTELDQARRTVIDIQRTVIGQIEPPIKNYTLTDIVPEKKETVLKKRPRSRRRPR